MRSTTITTICTVWVWIALTAPLSWAFAETSDGPRAFDTPEAAVDALLTALRTDDLPAVLEVLGADAELLLVSGDDVADRRARRGFVEAYDVVNDLVAESDEQRVLEVGEDLWPFPVPIRNVDGKWQFDAAAGIDEVVYRRIGRNELGTIETCLGLAAAQAEYVSEGRDGRPPGIYASKLVSDPGLRNGLYWDPVEGERASPIGPFLAEAAAEGYRLGTGPAPYHGYLYRLLVQQGPSAPGGAKPYLVGGVLSSGFAIIAYPVEYQSSGVKSFIVNQDGIVYEKDLGADTAAIAAAMDTFDPDDTWAPVAGTDAL